MKLENKIKSNLKNVEGRVAVFGSLYDSCLSFINKNKKILSCDLISEYSFFRSNSSSKSKGKAKKFNIKKIKKIYGKKGIDTILINLDEFDKYKKTLIRDSVFISSKEIIIFSFNKDYDYDMLMKRYKRYNCTSDYFELDNGFIIIIDTTFSKTKRWLNKFYFIKDTLYDVSETISNFIIN